MIILTCEQCGKSYTAKPYMAKLSDHHFCGSVCYGEWQKTHRKGHGKNRITVTCHTCGKTFEKQPSAVTEHNFCSRDCFGKWRQSPDWCGENNPSWLGGNTDYRGGNWQQQRAAARERDRDTCQCCGFVAEHLPVHHVVPFHLFDNYQKANDLSNLVTLCPACHSAAELAFWQEHPEMVTDRRFPDCSPVKECRQCGKAFQPRSGATLVCDSCCNAVCAHCAQPFYSRKAVHRQVKYCSRECRNAAIKRKPQVCAGCGKEYMPNRQGTMYCSNHCRMTLGNPRRQFFAKRRLAAQE
jgi:hypothetical protein